MDSWGSAVGLFSATPLADRNGRIRTDQAKPAANSFTTPTRPEEDVVTMSQGEADKIREKLCEQKNRLQEAERQVASQDKLIKQLTSNLATCYKAGYNGGRLGPDTPSPEWTKGEKTLELAAVRMQLEQTQQRLETKDAEVDRLIPEVVASRMKESQRLSVKEADIERFRRELENSRGEATQLRAEVRMLQQRLESKDEEMHRLLPQIVEWKTHKTNLHTKDAEIEQYAQRLQSQDAEVERLNHELSTLRVDRNQQRVVVSTKDTEIEQLTEQLRNKDGEVDRLKRELSIASMERDQCRHQASTYKDAEMEQFARRLQSKDVEIDRLGREVHMLRMEQNQQRLSTRQSDSAFEDARINMSIKLAEKRKELDRREQAVAAREAVVQRASPFGATAGHAWSCDAPLPGSRTPRGTLWESLNH